MDVVILHARRNVKKILSFFVDKYAITSYICYQRLSMEVNMDRMNSEDIHDSFLEWIKEVEFKGATTFDVSNITAHLVADLVYSTAPSTELATHLLLSAMNSKLSHILELDDDDE
jgi:hypothetical protein